MVKIPPANAGNSSIGWGDPLEEKMAREIPWTEEPGGLLSMGSERVKHD